MTTSEKGIEAVLDSLDGVRKTGRKQWEARCPVHGDRKASLTISIGDDEKVLLHCHANCSTASVVEAMGLTMSDLFPAKKTASVKRTVDKTYDYFGPNGKLRHQVVRYKPKEFRQRQQDASGDWQWNLDGVECVLYRLSELNAADPSKRVYICEGEKDADCIAELGLVSTTNAGGANKWKDIYNETLRGRRVVILPDNDDPGREHADKVARELQGIAAEVRIVALPDLPPKGDVSDWIDKGGTVAGLEKLVDAAPVWTSNESPKESDTHVPDPEPMRLAEHFNSKVWRGNLRRFRQEWWAFQPGQGRYQHLSDEEMSVALYQHLDRLTTARRNREGDVIPNMVQKIKPNSSLVAEVAKALPCGLLVNGNMPKWLDDRDRPATANVVAFQNGLLDAAAYPTGAIIPSASAWFSASACPFAFDGNADCPNWLAFLSDAFDGDAESIDLLQEWFGLQLVPDNSYEKIMMLIGQPRSGKGTTITALSTMLGDDQVAVTSFSKLSSRFGLAPLVGKLSAILPDAHIGRSVDAKAALEVLKSVSGGDEQAVDRKNVDELPKVTIQARFTIAVNELPELPDTAGAIEPRLLLLHYPQTFAGREDLHLKARVRTEGPGIATWALEGLRRLREQGFTVPARSRQMVEEFERTVSPVKSFVQDHCELITGAWTPKADLYAAWEAWCKSRGDVPGNMAQFGHQLIGAAPVIKAGRRGPREQQFTTYEGVRLCQ